MGSVIDAVEEWCGEALTSDVARRIASAPAHQLADLDDTLANHDAGWHDPYPRRGPKRHFVTDLSPDSLQESELKRLLLYGGPVAVVDPRSSFGLGGRLGEIRQVDYRQEYLTSLAVLRPLVERHLLSIVPADSVPRPPLDLGVYAASPLVRVALGLDHESVDGHFLPGTSDSDWGDIEEVPEFEGEFLRSDDGDETEWHPLSMLRRTDRELRVPGPPASADSGIWSRDFSNGWLTAFPQDPAMSMLNELQDRLARLLRGRGGEEEVFDLEVVDAVLRVSSAGALCLENAIQLATVEAACIRRNMLPAVGSPTPSMDSTLVSRIREASLGGDQWASQLMENAVPSVDHIPLERIVELRVSEPLFDEFRSRLSEIVGVWATGTLSDVETEQRRFSTIATEILRPEIDSIMREARGSSMVAKLLSSTPGPTLRIGVAIASWYAIRDLPASVAASEVTGFASDRVQNVISRMLPSERSRTTLADFYSYFV